MLTVVVYFLLISLTCLWTGYASHFYFARLLQKVPPPAKSLMVYLLWGLISLSLVAQILELFMPVNQITWIGIVVLLGIVSFQERKRFDLGVRLRTYLVQVGWWRLASCFLILIFISNFSAGPLQMDDTESYHIQMIKWIQEYGSVPGLANLHERYGFNSSWFGFVALFAPARTVRNYYSTPNGVISVWLCCYLLNRSLTWTRRPGLRNGIASGSLLVLLAALFCWPMIRGNATTANYDFITTTLLTVLMIELSSNSRQEWQRYLPEIILWPFFLFTVRIVNFPALLLSLAGLSVLLRSRDYRSLTGMLTVSAALIIAFLVRNVILSGYLFYPACQIDLFPVDWKADPERTRSLVEFIKYFNRVNTGSLPLPVTQKLLFPDWIPVWYHYLFRYDKPVLLAGLGGYLLFLVRWKKFRDTSPPVRWMAGAMAIQLVAWFFIAPDPRFAYGPLLCGIYLLGMMVPFRWPALPYQARYVASMVLLAFVAGYTTWRVVRYPASRSLLHPVQVPQPVFRTVRIDGIELRIPEKIPGNWNRRCYATDLPCLYEIMPGLHARGRTVADGFKLAP